MGYGSEAAFSRAFKRATGSSPVAHERVGGGAGIMPPLDFPGKGIAIHRALTNHWETNARARNRVELRAADIRAFFESFAGKPVSPANDSPTRDTGSAGP